MKANQLCYLLERAGYLISDTILVIYRMSDYPDIKA